MPVRHALVVDDSKSARLMLRKMLQGLGVDVDVAESGEEALNYLRNRRTDAVFLDHIMPGIDGLSTLRSLKADSATAALPVAMYTSRDDAEYRDEALAAGAIGVLTKPTVPEVLKALLEQMHHVVDGKALPPEPVTKVASAAVISNIPKPPTAPTTFPVGDAPSLDVIERLIASKTEAAFYEATETQVLPLINDVIAKLRKEIEASHNHSARSIAAQVCDERLATWRPPPPTTRPINWTEEGLQARISSALDERLETFQGSSALEEQIRDLATQVCATQVQDISERVVHKLNAQFSETIRRVALTVHDSAVSAAEQAAREGLRSHASNSAHLHEQMEALIADNNVQLRRQMRRLIYVTASSAALLGIGAAALVYWLR